MYRNTYEKNHLFVNILDYDKYIDQSLKFRDDLFNF